MSHYSPMIKNSILVSHRMFPFLKGRRALISPVTFETSKVFFSSEPKHVTKDPLVLTKVNEKGTIATLTLNRFPSNSLNLSLNEAISQGIRDIQSEHKNVKALILSSSNPDILSAGLDLKELYLSSSEHPSFDDVKRLKRFWLSVQQVFLDLYGCKFATVAAIEGHAPAAGCMLAMACDYRIMAGSNNSDSDNMEGSIKEGKIGLNESTFGIAAPYWMADLMKNTIGFRQAEKSLGLGILYSPKEALDIGLVDELVPSKETVITRANEVAEVWSKIPAEARFVSKMLTRRPILEELKRNREADVEQFARFVSSMRVQKSLGMYLESLKKRKK